MRNKLFLFCLLLVTLKGVVWSSLVPLWHFPDEQAHFAQVSYLAEIGRYPFQDGGDPEDLSEEIFISEQLLGTDRYNGINRFTYHPEFRIPYTNFIIGLHEEEIVTLPKETRTHYVKYEAANYPALYYLTMILPYRLFYSSDLFVRMFATRMFNLVYVVLFAVVTWKIASFIFPRNPFYAAAFTLFINFQPMFTFVSSGVTSDNAINLWFAAFLLWGLIMLYVKPSLRALLVGTLLMLVGPLVKQQSIIVVPIFLVFILFGVIKKYHWISRHKLLLVLGSFMILILGSAFALQEDSPVRSFLAIPLVFDMNLLQESVGYFRWTLEHTIREVFPWYWGVFNWLGVVLPRPVNRIIIRIVGIAIIGLLILLFRRIRYGTFRRYDRALILFALISLLYFFGMTAWDYVFFSKYHYSFGIQGRYFFPTIIAHLALLVMGFRALLPEKWNRWWPLCFYGFLVGMIGLNMHALSVVLGSYYSFESLEVFSMQVSQYKPLLFKFPWVFGWMGLYFTALIVVLGFLARDALLLYRQKTV